MGELDPRVKGDRGILACFNKADGALIWQAAHNRLKHRINDLPGLGICSRPFFEDGKVYYVSNRGELICLDLNVPLEKGAVTHPKVVWTLDMPTDLGVFRRDSGDSANPVQSPIVVGDLVYCVTGNGSVFGCEDVLPHLPFVPNPMAPSFVAVNKKNGKLCWSSNRPGRRIMYSQWSTPAFAKTRVNEQVLFPGGDGVLYAFSLGGQFLYSVDLNEMKATDWGPRKRGGRAFPSQAPLVMRGVAYVAINHELEFPSFGRCSICAVDLESRDTNRIKWRFKRQDYDGTFGMLAAGRDRDLFALSTSGLLLRLDLQTGKVLDAVELQSRAAFLSSPYCYRDRVFVNTEDSLVVLAIRDGRLRIAGRFSFDDGIVGSPTIDGNELYLATRSSLWALSLKDLE